MLTIAEGALFGTVGLILAAPIASAIVQDLRGPLPGPGGWHDLGQWANQSLPFRLSPLIRIRLTGQLDGPAHTAA